MARCADRKVLDPLDCGRGVRPQDLCGAAFSGAPEQEADLPGETAADPWVIAKVAVTSEGCVISEKTEKPNAARIPTVCSHFGVKCLTLEGLMRTEGWKY
ncbi:MAG: DUF4411 family protein [Gemmatimonadales bacterium]